MRLSLVATIATVVAALGLTAPAHATAPDSNTAIDQHAAALVPSPVKKQGVLTVASDASYAPFEYFAADNKTMIGYDVDVSDAIGATLGLKVKHVNVTFDSILPGLAAGKYSFAVSGFGITAEREKVVDFVGPYFIGGSGLAVAKGNTLGLTLAEPRSLCGHSIGGETGTIQVDAFLPKMSKDCVSAGKRPITIRTYATQTQSNLALSSGRIEGVLSDQAPLIYEAKMSNGRFAVAPGPSYKPVAFGIALPKASPLEPAVRAALKKIETDGTLAKLLKKWDMPSGWLSAAGG